MLVKTREAVRLFSVTERTLFAWRKAGCPCLKMAKEVLWDPEQVRAWATRQFGAAQDDGRRPK
jgi:phage terminase Nu1 subunit (DNA packaging protein)